MSDNSLDKLEWDLNESIRLARILTDLYQNKTLFGYIANPAISKDLDKVIEAALTKLKYYIGHRTIKLSIEKAKIKEGKKG